MADIDNFDNGMTDEEMVALEEENRQPVNPEPQVIEEKKDGEDTTAKPVQAEEKDTPPATPTEEKIEGKEETGSDPEKPPKVETPQATDEDKLPFHKHPRWIAQQQKLKDKEAEIEDLKRRVESVESRPTPAVVADEDQVLEIPNWFAELYGSEDPEKDQEVYRRYLGAEKQREDELVERVTGRVAADKAQQTEQEKADLEWVDTQISSVRENLEDGDPAFEDNELLKIIRDYRPMKEENGELVPDFGAAYAILKGFKSASPAAPVVPKPKQPTDQKKALAAHAPAAVGEPEAGTVASNESLALDPPW